MVLLALSVGDLHLSPDQFAAKVTGMRISTSIIKFLLRVGEEILPQVEEFKYLGVLFTSEWKMVRLKGGLVWRLHHHRTLRWSIVVKRELSRKLKLLFYRSIFVPTVTCGHEFWIVGQRMRLRVQAAKMSFLRGVAGLFIKDRVKSSAIQASSE